MLKIPFNTGTLAGIIGFLLFLLMYMIGISPIGVGRYVGFWVPIVAVLMANFQQRKKVLGGYMTYWQGFSTGFITIMVWSTFKAFSMVIFIRLFGAKVIEQYLTFSVDLLKKMETFGADTGDAIEQIRESTALLTPEVLMMNDIFVNGIYGCLLVFIIAFITKRNPPYTA